MDKITVMAVDDDPIILAIIRKKLEKKQVDVITHTDGSKAIEDVMADPPNLLILDLSMDDKHGLEVLQEVRKKYHREILPILILTATKELGTLKDVACREPNDIVLKNDNLQALMDRIDQYIKFVSLDTVYDLLRRGMVSDDSTLNKSFKRCLKNKNFDPFLISYYGEDYLLASENTKSPRHLASCDEATLNNVVEVYVKCGTAWVRKWPLKAAA